MATAKKETYRIVGKTEKTNAKDSIKSRLDMVLDAITTMRNNIGEASQKLIADRDLTNSEFRDRLESIWDERELLLRLEAKAEAFSEAMTAISQEETLESLIEYERVEDWIVTALEGGSNYWCYIKQKHQDDIIQAYKNEYNHPSDSVLEPLTLMIAKLVWEKQYKIPFFAEDTGMFLGFISKHRILFAISEMHTMKQPQFFQFINPDADYDAQDADVFFQFAVLGKLVYG